MTKREEKKPMGRPPEIGETRSVYVMAKCTTEERDRWNKGAEEKNLTVAEVIRRHLNRLFGAKG